jgi:alkylation response protein AidB-like acyl-CoA dehydrogenase
MEGFGGQYRSDWPSGKLDWRGRLTGAGAVIEVSLRGPACRERQNCVAVLVIARPGAILEASGPSPAVPGGPMDLSYSDTYRALQAEVRAFIEANKTRSPKAVGVRRKPDAGMLAWQQLLVEKGYAARTVPKTYGGFGAEPDVMESAIIAEEFSKAGVAAGIMSQGISMLVPTLAEVGTEAQRERWIRPTIRGEIIWCQGYSEPGAGSDLANVQTKAVLDGDHFVVNGQKIWTSSAHYADWMFLLCRTEADKPKHQGLSYLLLSMKTPGIVVRPLRTMTGKATFNEVFFTDVRVPADQIVMGRGDGWTVANITLKYERMMLGDANKFMHRVHRIKELMETTHIEGERLIDKPEWRDRLVRLQGEVMASKYHQMRLLTSAAKGDDPGLGRLVVKLYGTEMGYRLSGLAVDVYGAAGLAFDPHDDLDGGTDDEPTAWHVDHMYDLGLIIGGGSSQIQKNIISERGLGMPREPKAAPLAPTKG